MSFVGFTPVVKNFTLRAAAAQDLTWNFTDSAGQPVDAHAYSSLTFYWITKINGVEFPLQASDLISQSTPTFSTPATKFHLTAAQAETLRSALQTGSVPYELYAVHSGGDDPELIASGQATIDATLANTGI
ncbi:MAG: hypothetical protein C5B59_11520 [Bacteroidetes bacterium]|nr:MAG: hypothetical protein C5B59_11520 [Bacteroidota bacterium]